MYYKNKIIWIEVYNLQTNFKIREIVTLWIAGCDLLSSGKFHILHWSEPSNNNLSKKIFKIYYQINFHSFYIFLCIYTMSYFKSSWIQLNWHCPRQLICLLFKRISTIQKFNTCTVHNPFSIKHITFKSGLSKTSYDAKYRNLTK